MKNVISDAPIYEEGLYTENKGRKMNSEFITTDVNNLYNAAKRVRESSSNKQTTQRFMRDKLHEIARAQEELHNRTWKIEQMRPFLIYERGHKRKIQGNTPYDRMILHSYLDFSLEPELAPFLIYDNYASQVGKGVDLARKRFKNYLGSAYREYGNNQFYMLSIDFKKFYDNVQHQKLYDEIMRHIPYDPFHEYMLWTILDSFKVDVSWMNDDEYEHCMGTVYVALDHVNEELKGEKYMAKSLNIGNQASQLFSIFYPTRIDNYFKIVRGMKRYGRYMDDISVIHNDKDLLWQLLDEVYPICEDMGLFINEKKTQIHKVNGEFKYLNRVYKVSESGYIGERLVTDTIKREKRRIKKYNGVGKPIDNQYKSWNGSFEPHMTMHQKEDMRRFIKEVKDGNNQIC